MNEVELTYEQNLCAAVAFLKMFNLNVDDFTDISLGDSVIIRDEIGKEKGIITFENNKFNISAQSVFGQLDASYKWVSAVGFVDFESEGCPNFAAWNTNIDYSIDDGSVIKMDGNFIIDCSLDSEFGSKFICHSCLDYYVGDNIFFQLELQKNGRTFYLKYKKDEMDRTIIVMPFDSLNGYIKYIVVKGEYDSEFGGYPYRKFSGIYESNYDGSNKICSFSSVREYDDLVESKSEYYDMIEEGSKEFIMFIGNLMQQLDLEMHSEIDSVKNWLTEGNISLLDNFIAASLESFDDEEVKALLGLERRSIKDSGKVKKLSQIYFGEDGKYFEQKKD